MINHPLPPIFDDASRILILGSFPSVKSREVGFFYGHPQNRFWRILAAVFEAPVPQTIPEKRAFLHTHHIALWDVIASCEIKGSADSSIRAVTPNDIASLLERTSITTIFTNGKTSFSLYNRWLAKSLGRRAVYLPSSSPANASYSLDALIAAWQILRA